MKFRKTCISFKEIDTDFQHSNHVLSLTPNRPTTYLQRSIHQCSCMYNNSRKSSPNFILSYRVFLFNCILVQRSFNMNYLESPDVDITYWLRDNIFIPTSDIYPLLSCYFSDSFYTRILLNCPQKGRFPRERHAYECE